MTQEPKEPRGRKIYTKLNQEINLKYQLKDFVIPNIWIDSTDVETVKAFTRFWYIFYVNLKDYLLKIQPKCQQQYLQMLRQCTETCPEQPYMFEHCTLNFFIKYFAKHIEINAKERLLRKQKAEKQKNQKKASNTQSTEIQLKAKDYKSDIKERNESKPPVLQIKDKHKVGLLKRCFSGIFSSHNNQKDKTNILYNIQKKQSKQEEQEKSLLQKLILH